MPVSVFLSVSVPVSVSVWREDEASFMVLHSFLIPSPTHVAVLRVWCADQDPTSGFASASINSRLQNALSALWFEKQQ